MGALLRNINIMKHLRNIIWAIFSIILLIAIPIMWVNTENVGVNILFTALAIINIGSYVWSIYKTVK